jgi:hypothetical protein
VALGGIPLFALIAAAVGAAAPAGRAPMMRVDFDAPAGCSSAEAFRRGVATRLERAATSDGMPPARIQVRLTRNGDRVVGELRLSHEQAAPDTRTVEGATCDEVVDVLALTAALALQPGARSAPRTGAAAAPPPARSPGGGKEAGAAPRATAPRTAGAAAPAGTRAGSTPATPRPAREAPAVAAPRPAREAPAVASASAPTPAPTPAPAEIAAPAPPPAPATIVERPPPPSAPAGAHLEVGASAALARVLTSGPGPNLGGGVMLGVSRAREHGVPRSLRLGWLYLPNDFLLHGSAVADRWYAFTLTACPGWGLREGAFDVQVCARGIGGWITARDVAVTNPSSASRAWASAGALLRGGAALGAGFALEIEAGVDAPLFHREFITTPPRKTVAETPPVSLLVGVGLSRRL